MKNGKYQGRHEAKASSCGQKKIHLNGRLTAMVIATVMLLALAIGGTVAWLTDTSPAVVNTFTPSHVSCKVEETFNNQTGVKSKVQVKNTSDIPAFIRVKLVTYRTNGKGQHIGGTATVPDFQPGTNWVLHEGYYYYTQPVQPQNFTGILIEQIKLQDSYTDADGGRQAIDVMAEAIQSVPEAAVKDAWGTGFSINTDGSLNVQ